MEKQDPQDRDLQHQRLYDQWLQRDQQKLQRDQQKLQRDQQKLQRDQPKLQRDQQLLQQYVQQSNQLMLQSNQLMLQSNQQLLQCNQLLLQHSGQPHSMPFHQVPYRVYHGPGPMHGIARPVMAKALSTPNAGESCTSREENRSISDDQTGDNYDEWTGDYYEWKRNIEALIMDVRHLQDQTAEWNRLFLQFQEMELKEKSRIQEILQERQNNLQNPAPDSSQDPVSDSVGQEGPRSNEEQTLSGDQQVSVRDPERDSVRDPETPE